MAPAVARGELTGLQRALRGTAEDAPLYVRMAQIYEALGERGPAFHALQAARRVAPDDPAVAAALGAAHEARREYDLAIEEYRRALRHPAPAPVRIALASLYISLGWSREARAVLEEARRRAPEDVGVRMTLAMLHVQREQMKDAEAQLHVAQRLDPGNERIESLLSHVYDLAGRPEEALAAIRHAIARRPEEPDYRIQLGELLLRREDPGAAREAETAFRAALERAPRDPRAWSGLARALRRQERIEEASELLEALSQRPRPDPVLLREWGRILLRRGRAKEGHVALARAARLERRAERLERILSRLATRPQDAALRRELGSIYLEQNDAPRAIVELKRSLADRPTDRRARDLLHRALRAAGREAEIDAG